MAELSLSNEEFHYVKEVLANSRMYSDNKTLYYRKDVHLEINKMFIEKIKYVPDRWMLTMHMLFWIKVKLQEIL